MKYVKECTELLNLALTKMGIAEEDFAETYEILKEQIGVSPESLSEDIEIGEKNGYSFEHQVNLVKEMLEKVSK